MSSRAFIMCREPTIEMKRDFVDMLFKLTPEQLAKIVQILNERCPSSLDKVVMVSSSDA